MADWQENMNTYGNIFGIDTNANMSNTGNIFGIDTSNLWGQNNAAAAGTSDSAASSGYSMDGKTSGYYDDAHNYLDKAWGTLDEAKGYVSGLTGVANQTLDAWNQFKTEYDPAKKAALSLAGQEYGAKSGYLSKLQNVDNQTYNAEAGRAGADVAQQAEIARQEQARAMARQGVNAASGKSQALTQQGFLQEALAKAGAMTSARDKARDTNFNESLSAYNAIDPSKSVNTALGISNTANQLLGQYNGVMTTQAGLAGQNASTAGSLANTGVGLASAYGNTQLGYSKLNQQAASDAAQIGLGYYQANNNYDISNREMNIKEDAYRQQKMDNMFPKASSPAVSVASPSKSSSSSSGGTWKPLGAGMYNTATGEMKYNGTPYGSRSF